MKLSQLFCTVFIVYFEHYAVSSVHLLVKLNWATMEIKESILSQV